MMLCVRECMPAYHYSQPVLYRWPRPGPMLCQAGLGCRQTGHNESAGLCCLWVAATGAGRYSQWWRPGRWVDSLQSELEEWRMNTGIYQYHSRLKDFCTIRSCFLAWIINGIIDVLNCRNQTNLILNLLLIMSTNKLDFVAIINCFSSSRRRELYQWYFWFLISNSKVFYYLKVLSDINIQCQKLSV